MTPRHAAAVPSRTRAGMAVARTAVLALLAGTIVAWVVLPAVGWFR